VCLDCDAGAVSEPQNLIGIGTSFSLLDNQLVELAPLASQGCHDGVNAIQPLARGTGVWDGYRHVIMLNAVAVERLLVERASVSIACWARIPVE
jgi:hypothetical protein